MDSGTSVRTESVFCRHVTLASSVPFVNVGSTQVDPEILPVSAGAICHVGKIWIRSIKRIPHPGAINQTFIAKFVAGYSYPTPPRAEVGEVAVPATVSEELVEDPHSGGGLRIRPDCNMIITSWQTLQSA